MFSSDASKWTFGSAGLCVAPNGASSIYPAAMFRLYALDRLLFCSESALTMEASTSQVMYAVGVLFLAAAIALYWYYVFHLNGPFEIWRDRAERLYRRIQFGDPYFRPGTLAAIWTTLAFVILPPFILRDGGILLATLPLSIVVYFITWGSVRLYLWYTRPIGPWEQSGR